MYVVSDRSIYPGRRHVLRGGESYTLCGNLPSHAVRAPQDCFGGGEWKLPLCAVCAVRDQTITINNVFTTQTYTPVEVTVTESDAAKLKKAGDTVGVSGASVRVIPDPAPEYEYEVFFVSTGVRKPARGTQPRTIKATSPVNAVIEQASKGEHGGDGAKYLVVGPDTSVDRSLTNVSNDRRALLFEVGKTIGFHSEGPPSEVFTNKFGTRYVIRQVNV